MEEVEEDMVWGEGCISDDSSFYGEFRAASTQSQAPIVALLHPTKSCQVMRLNKNDRSNLQKSIIQNLSGGHMART